jgi:hypothetical protein
MNERAYAFGPGSWGFILPLAMVVAAIVAQPAATAGEVEETAFVRGDANHDGFVSISDALMIRRHLFTGGPPPTCRDAGDVNDDGQILLDDHNEVLTRLFNFRTDGWASVFPEPYPLAGLDPTADDLPCAIYAVEPAESTEDVIQLGDVGASPGAEVEIPVYLTNSVDIDAFQLVIAYDPAAVTPAHLAFEGTFYERFFGDQQYQGNQPPVALLSARPDDGVFVVGISGNMAFEGYEITPGENQLVVKIVATVSQDAPPGTIALTPTNGENGEGVGPYRMRNELTYRGTARFASILPAAFPGHLIVNPDFVDFVRADSNGDGTVNISDAVFTLGFLFLDGASPACPDAADVNNDGTLDISDPVMGLNYLFVSSLVPEDSPPNLGICGPDSGESLGECDYTHCE